MGLFDFLSSKGAFGKHAARVANKRAQNPDRWESIQALAKLRSAEAVTALLARFTFRVDPSIVDQEEKDAAFHGILGAGELAIEPTRAFLRGAESVSWPLKVLEQLESPEEVVTDLLALLAAMDTEYERDPERKIQTLAYLEDRQDPRIVEAVTRFLGDVSETVRFHAVGAIFAQAPGEAACARDTLVQALSAEESVRCRARLLDGFVQRQWPLPPERRDELRPLLPAGYALDAQGVVRK